MRLFVEGTVAIGAGYIEVVDFGGHIEEAFRAKEKSIGGLLDSLDDTKALVEGGVGFARGEIKVPCSPFWIKAHGDGDGFQQGGFSSSVFSDDEGDFGVEFEGVQGLQGRQHEGISIERVNLFSQEGYAPDKLS